MTNNIKVYIVPNVGVGFEGAKWPSLSALTPIPYEDWDKNGFLLDTDGVAIAYKGWYILFSALMAEEHVFDYYLKALLEFVANEEVASST